MNNIKDNLKDNILDDLIDDIEIVIDNLFIIPIYDLYHPLEFIESDILDKSEAEDSIHQQSYVITAQYMLLTNEERQIFSNQLNNTSIFS